MTRVALLPKQALPDDRFEVHKTVHVHRGVTERECILSCDSPHKKNNLSGLYMVGYFSKLPTICCPVHLSDFAIGYRPMLGYTEVSLQPCSMY